MEYANKFSIFSSLPLSPSPSFLPIPPLPITFEETYDYKYFILVFLLAVCSFITTNSLVQKIMVVVVPLDHPLHFTSLLILFLVCLVLLFLLFCFVWSCHVNCLFVCLLELGETDKYRDCTQSFGPMHYYIVTLTSFPSLSLPPSLSPLSPLGTLSSEPSL